MRSATTTAQKFVVAMWVSAAATLGISAPASAGGYEFPGDGARAIGRGGAFAAKADDPMAVVVNPAALASLPGTQLWFTGHLLFAKDCFNRNVAGETPDGTPTPPAWDPGWGTNPSSTNPGGSIDYTEVCNQKGKRLSLIPAVAVSWRISSKVGMGFGIIPPNSERAQRWGGASYAVTTANGSEQEYRGYVDAPPGSVGSDVGPPSSELVPLNNGQDLLPASSRFLLVERDVIVVYPTFAVGVKPVRWLQIGAAFGWGIAGVTLITNVKNGESGEAPSVLEGQARLRGRDWFVPRVSASIHFIPHDNVDLVGVFRWDDDVRAKGNLSVKVPAFDDAVSSGLNTLQGKGTFVAPRPWWLTFGIRYADRISPRPDDPDAPGRESGELEDQMSNERWDLEVDVVYEKNSVVDNFTVDIRELSPSQSTDPVINTSVDIGHHWQDQLSIRAGGDWNVVPGSFALRSGFSYETSGFTGIGSKTSKGGTIDFMPGRRFGLHLGWTWRISTFYDRRLELSAAFSYFWMTVHNNANGGTQQVVVTPADGGAPLPGDVVNNGAFSSRYIALSGALRYLFKGRGGRKGP